MLKFKTLKDITINDFYELQSILGSDEPEEEKNINLVSFFYDMSIDDVLSLDSTKFAEYLNTISQIFIEQQNYKFTDPPKKIKICDTTYNIKLVVDKISVSQYLDFQNYCKKSENFGEILSIFLIPEGKKYGEGYDLKETIKIFNENVDIITAKEIADFFLNRLAVSTKNIMTYFKLVMMMETWKVKMKTWLTNLKTKIKKMIRL